jgi:cell division protein FtsW (lipid II flippase)
MIPNIIRWIALLFGTVLVVFIAGGVIFGGAYYIEGLRNGVESIKEPDADFYSLLISILIIISVIIAWFKKRLGAFLITVFAVASIILFYEPEVIWLQIAILPVGPILLIADFYYRRYLSKKRDD